MTRGVARTVGLALAWSLFILAALALALLLVSRDGGCDRTPPDDGDDRPVPACKPGDKECYGAAPLPAPGATTKD